MYSGIEEAVLLAEEMREGVSEIISAFLFLNTKNDQIICQGYTEEQEVSPFLGKNMMYCGRLDPSLTASEIFEMIKDANERYEKMGN